MFYGYCYNDVVTRSPAYNRKIRVQFQALSHTFCMIMGKVLNAYIQIFFSQGCTVLHSQYSTGQFILESCLFFLNQFCGLNQA